MKKRRENYKKPEAEYDEDVFDKLERESRGRRGGIVGNIILVIAVCLLCYSGYQLFQIFSEYNEGEKEYEKVQKIAIQSEKKDDDEQDKPKYTVDFKALKRINGDTAAWIKFDKPEEINYPVVQCMNNETYLTKTFEANDNKLGAIFIDARNSGDMSDRNTIIYGHNMNNGSMFAKLLNYKDQAYWDANRYFYIYTPDGKEHKYEIYAAGVIADDAANYQLNFASEAEFANYIAAVKKSSAYDTGVQVPEGAKTVTLSTCTNVRDDERYVVHGVEIQE